MAERLLLKRNAAIEEDRTINLKVNRCKIDELFEMVVTGYRMNKKKSLVETGASGDTCCRSSVAGVPAPSPAIW